MLASHELGPPLRITAMPTCYRDAGTDQQATGYFLNLAMLLVSSGTQRFPLRREGRYSCRTVELPAPSYTSTGISRTVERCFGLSCDTVHPATRGRS